ncbi:phosphonate metabolism protein [Gemmobacter aquarius]|uniref:Phosphonate metabolism protein n=1 Tax=Paragemmobacter aquarius TaxID=2169400 RepID=A0A2S0UP32_9RHOB|nr:DUF1045 domain-containing protein [Gemmobacter aquarius]AWB49550.1 phosphonate metabolism protein [Gemmobacter aquarius]
MEKFRRYAIYFAPRAGDFADRAAAWLGWSAERGEVPHPEVAGLPLPLHALTATPRKYGFHGTIKPPFALAAGVGAHDMHEAVAALAARIGPVSFARLRLERIGGFLALVPEGDQAALQALGAEVVTALDRFRAPLTEADIARRRPERLTSRQRELLDRWGYPYVMEEFRFHLTLTGDLAADMAQAVMPVAQGWFGPALPEPFRIEDLCLFGEAADGRFHLVHRYALAG